MKIALVSTCRGFDKINPTAPVMVATEISTESQFSNNTRLFSPYIENPFSIGKEEADVLPKSSRGNLDEEFSLFVERLTHYNPDIIEVHEDELLSIKLAKALPHMSVINYCHNSNIYTHKYLHNRIRHALFHAPLTHTIYVCRFIDKKVGEHIPPEYRSVITNARPPQAWRADGNKKEKIILFSGRVTVGKGAAELIEALQQVLPKYPDWKAVFLALNLDHPSFYEEQKSITEKTLKEQCLWLANMPQDRVQEWVKKASISIIPSNWDEVFPLVALEAHYARCAVISSGRGGMPEISGADGALYLDEVSPKDIAAKLSFLIENETEREALAKRGHEYAMKHHDIKKRARELDELRLKIIARAKEESKTPRQWRATMRRKKWYTTKSMLAQKISEILNA